MKEYTNQLMLFQQISGKKVQVDFNGGQVGSDAGLLFFRAIEKKTGMIQTVASVIPEWRHPGYVRHEIYHLLTQRVFQIACGYQDANDCNSLRKDPLFKMSCESLPGKDDLLASQPTMCRFENAPSRTVLYRIGQALLDLFINSYTKPPEAIIIDIDDTDDRTHGAQQLSLFNAYYDSYCYQPIHIFEGISGKLITSILRPGKRPSGEEIQMIVSRVFDKIKSSWPQTKVIFRGDAHYTAPEVLACCDKYNYKFVLGLNSNPVLLAKADHIIKRAKELYEYHRKSIKLYGEFFYQAHSWAKEYRVIVKVEYTAQGANIRFIVTNLQHCQRKFVYEKIYCGRGQAELLIKELKNHLHSDRTSCSSFAANQFRLFMHSLAYMLVHYLREKYLAGTELAKATIDSIRLKLLKIGARVIELSTKIKIHLASGYPLKNTFYQVYQLCNSS